MDIRQEFAFKHLKKTSARILEMGPLNRPIVDKTRYPNSRYCDIRNTDEVRQLYSGNAYLEATGVWVDTEAVVEIDDVIQESYTKTYEGKEKFDAVIASHVLEHMDDLIFSLQDIAGILKPGGLFIIVYPDKRYCFDHFRQSASIRDAYTVFRHGTKHNVPMVLDFYLNAVHENDPVLFWSGEDLTHLLSADNERTSLGLYEEALSGKRMDDVHYWPFTDRDFLLFLRDCARLKLLPFRCIDFLPTQENDQQFLLALRYDPLLMEHPQSAIESFEGWLPKALPHYYTSKIKQEHILCEKQAELEREIVSLGAELEICGNQLAELRTLLSEKDALLLQKDSLLCQKDGLIEEKNSMFELQARALDELRRMKQEADLLKSIQESRIAALETIENSTIWRMTKPIRVLLDLLKQITKGST